jgi:hypothetical protein
MVHVIREMLMESSRRLADNHVFATMAREDFDALSSFATRTILSGGHVVNEADTDLDMAHFPVGAVLSVINSLENGQGVEICTIGHENAYGLANAVGSPWAGERVICQVPGFCYQLPIARLKQAAAKSTGLTELLIRHVQASSAQTGQSVACNAIHSVEARLCRWLLMCQDRAGVKILPLTHEFIGYMLGVQRTTVTLAARNLQAAGLIRYRRGNIEILDRDGLLESACECYAAGVHKHARLLEGYLRLR